MIKNQVSEESEKTKIKRGTCANSHPHGLVAAEDHESKQNLYLRMRVGELRGRRGVISRSVR
jgi:hypothetical protein